MSPKATAVLTRILFKNAEKLFSRVKGLRRTKQKLRLYRLADAQGNANAIVALKRLGA
jgi:hypothetical protein